jgi:hypothetical protein
VLIQLINHELQECEKYIHTMPLIEMLLRRYLFEETQQKKDEAFDCFNQMKKHISKKDLNVIKKLFTKASKKNSRYSFINLLDGSIFKKGEK